MRIKLRCTCRSGFLDRVEVVPAPDTGRILDSLEQLIFLLFNEAMWDIVTAYQVTPEDDLTEVLGTKFCIRRISPSQINLGLGQLQIHGGKPDQD